MLLIHTHVLTGFQSWTLDCSEGHWGCAKLLHNNLGPSELCSHVAFALLALLCQLCISPGFKTYMSQMGLLYVLARH